MKNYISLLVVLVVVGVVSAASIPPESGLAAPTDAGSTVSPYSIITAGGSGFIPSVPMSPVTPPSIVIVPPTMPPAVANFVKKVKAAKAAMSASLLLPAV